MAGQENGEWAMNDNPLNRKLRKKLICSFFLLLLFGLWVTPVFRSFNHRSGSVYTYRAKKEIFVSVHSSRWEWKTNLLSFIWSEITSVVAGGYSGPIGRSEQVLYKLSCSIPELVLSANGSVGEMVIYKNSLFLVNSEYPNGYKRDSQFAEVKKAYLWNGKNFISVPTKLSVEQWRDVANEVISSQVSLTSSNSFNVCGRKATVVEDHNRGTAIWSCDGKEQVLFKGRPDVTRFGW